MSEAEAFWAGDFGNAYTRRNRSAELVRANERFFRTALSRTFYQNVHRVIEFGANRGNNIEALRAIDCMSLCEYTGVEINAEARADLIGVCNHVYPQSMLDPTEPWGTGYDLSISKGVLIHIEPGGDLLRAYGALYRASKRFILLAEYHSPTPVEVEYRGHSGRLWKRDFASEMLMMFKDLKFVDCGFAWKHHPTAAQDDLVWTLLEKVSPETRKKKV